MLVTPLSRRLRWFLHRLILTASQGRDCVETASGFPLTPLKFQGYEVPTFCDDVKGNAARELSAEEAWETTYNFACRQKDWDNPVNVITEQELASLRAKAKRLFGSEKVWFEMPRCIAWDKVDNSSPQSTPQVLPSFEVYTSPMTYPKEVEKTTGIPIEVEPFDQTQIEDLGLNTCSHDLFLSSREVPRVYESEPHL
ncbi:hypothetical protein Tco_1001416 [Tanacetum coccineum]